jgi:outer membrane receptor protein involved in Fe transport
MRHASTRLLACAVLATAVLPCPARAQSPPATSPAQPAVPQIAEQVEVVATKVAEPVDEVPAAIEVLSGDELRARGVTDLRTALAFATGVDVAPGGDGGPASAVPEFWGLKEFDAFLLVVDNVPWGGAFNPALATLSLEDVERIEARRPSRRQRVQRVGIVPRRQLLERGGQRLGVHPARHVGLAAGRRRRAAGVQRRPHVLSERPRALAQ